MSEREIHSIKRKFIIASTLSFFFVMLMMGGLIYLFTTITARNEVRQVIDYIVENDGDLPRPSGSSRHSREDESDASGETDAAEETDMAGETGAVEESDAAEGTDAAGTGAAEDSGSAETTVAESSTAYNLEEDMTWSLADFFGTGDVMKSVEDFLYSTRYFAVLFDASDEVEEIKTSHISRVNEEEAEYYARVARDRIFRFGSFGYFYYEVADRADGGTIVVYLDRTQQNAYGMRIFYAALILIGLGSIAAFLVMRLVSRRIVASEVENAERQKQFITNASHELKTPLAVIRANTEMQEMLEGETEWTQSTMRQVGRMEGLIANLVMIARARERSSPEGLTPLNPAVPVRETAESFRSVAVSEGKILTVETAEGLQMLGDDASLRQLTSLLTDNAVKYCDDGGSIGVTLEKQGKRILLEITNTYRDGDSVDPGRFFERFYREDDSHNTDRGGYGIGLSVAESLTKQMKGKISAAWKDGRIHLICSFPL